jgi:DNA-binding LacI/PurR family transcriptional regulator
MLVTQRTQTLAIVFQYAELFSSGSGFINEVMRGVCAGAVENGYDLMLHTQAVGSPDTEADLLGDGRVDGALVLRDEGDPTVATLLDRGMPTVLFFTRSDHPNAAWVDADNFSGAKLAVKHLIELGHRRIMMIRGPEGSVAARARYFGYLAALDEAGLQPTTTLPRYGSPSEVHGEFATHLRSDDPPTALFVWSDDVAVACLEVARDLGFSLPSELSVVGFDSLDICNRTVPPLTSVRQPIFAMANDATRLLISIARKESLSQKQIVYPLSLDMRGSTAPPLHVPSTTR